MTADGQMMTSETPLEPGEIRHWSFRAEDDGDPQADVAEVIAMFEGKDVDELTPVYDAIDSFMSNLFTSPPPEPAQAKIEFTYEGYRVSVYQDGEATFLKIGE
ncbi:HalOD1 output domain-containing protein [Haladaptatus salinisoli]|uniref:HalOD1 output domain-containing protein n=1 Tax=Haladaptatus salinisoli TaxID=2884876 RepID=UPI001D09C1DB|nr:HalOD1 output domain-containing protein [Haladaptatus salinisoli]